MKKNIIKNNKTIKEFKQFIAKGNIVDWCNYWWSFQ